MKNRGSKLLPASSFKVKRLFLCAHSNAIILATRPIIRILPQHPNPNMLPGKHFESINLYVLNLDGSGNCRNNSTNEWQTHQLNGNFCARSESFKEKKNTALRLKRCYWSTYKDRNHMHHLSIYTFISICFSLSVYVT